MPRWTPENPRPHGRTRYVLGGYAGDTPCRCDICTADQARYNRELKRRTTPAYVAAGPVREHIAWLATQGVGLKQIAKVSGVAHGALWKIVYGVPSVGRPPSRRVRPETATKILAVMPIDGADGSRIPLGPTLENVNQLLARGWTKRAIAHAIGQTSGALQLGENTITRGNARAIAALLDQPVPDNVGRSWSLHHQAQAGPDVADEPDDEEVRKVHQSRDRVLLSLVELLEARIDQNYWRRDAACRNQPSWIFFPARGDHVTLAAAKKICGTCLVREECLQANLQERDGVYGGLSGRERRLLRSEEAA